MQSTVPRTHVGRSFQPQSHDVSTTHAESRVGPSHSEGGALVPGPRAQLLCGGNVFDDIDIRRNDTSFLDAVGARAIPDPTTELEVLQHCLTHGSRVCVAAQIAGAYARG